MTTIVFRNGTMAADGQVTDGSWAREHGAAKLYVHRGHKAVIGISGNCDHFPMQAQACLAEVLSGEPTEWRSGSFQMQCALLDAEGNVKTYSGYNQDNDKGHMMLDVGKYMADGSGRDFAVGAMEMGADATDAVHVASRCDVYTDSKISYYNVVTGEYHNVNFLDEEPEAEKESEGE